MSKTPGSVRGITRGAIVLMLTGIGIFVMEWAFPDVFRWCMKTVAIREERVMTTNDMFLVMIWSRFLPIGCLLIGTVLLLYAITRKKLNR